MRALFVLFLFLVGCAGHESRVRLALDALDRGAPEEAAAELNLELEVESIDEVPEEIEGDDALLLLDRATVLQSMGRYDLAARDFGLADKSIEVLDLSRGGQHELGRYLFSDDVGPYRAPAFEKLLINSFNMLNYLAREDLGGARVEARRLAVMQRYLIDQGETTPMIGLGSWLAGFTFEKSGSNDEARRYYEEALRYDEYPSLEEALRRMGGGPPPPPPEPPSPTLPPEEGGSDAPSIVLPAVPEPPSDEAELVVVVGYGRVPPKLPTRIPIGLALTIVAADISPHDHALATELAAKGLVTWVNFPRLGKGQGAHAVPKLTIDGRPLSLEHALDVEAEVRKEWEEREGTVILAAITRMIARLAVSTAVQAGVTSGNKKDRGAVGLLAGLATAATLTVLDTPDTRSWTTLPANVALARLRLPPGRHEITIEARGRRQRHTVTLAPRGWKFLAMTSLR